MKLLLTSILLLLACVGSQAQPGFVKGYLITDKGDTLKGEIRINPKKEQDLYAKVFFKEASGMQKSHKPEKTKGYGFEDKTFVSVGSDDGGRFFQVVVKGPISFYKTMVEATKMNEIIYLPEYYLSKMEDKIPILVKESRFKKQLAELMKDNSQIADSYPDDKKFDFEKAVEVIKNYNAWRKGK